MTSQVVVLDQPVRDVAGMQMHTVSLRGTTVRWVDVAGPPSSPPILFLHGVTDSLESYAPAMSQLAGEHRMFAMDFRGHGLSAHATPYRITDYADDVRRFITDVVGAPVVLAGHSLGGLVSVCVGARATDLVRGLFLEDPPIYTARMPALRDTSDYQFFVALREVLGRHRASSGTVHTLASLVGTWPIHPMPFDGRSLLEVAGPDAVAARATSLHRMDPAALEAVLDGSQFDGFDPDEALAAVRAPVHVLAGDVAVGGTLDRPEDLASVVRRYTCRTLPGVGHFIHHTVPADYANEVRTFVTAC